MATIHWRPGSPDKVGRWNNPDHWSGAKVPGASDDVVINRPGTYDVYITYFADANSLTIRNPDATVQVERTLFLGSTLDLMEGALDLDFGGNINGGTLKAGQGVFDWRGGILTDVTFDGPINLTSSFSSLYIVGELTLAGENGSGPGVINLTGPNATLEVTAGITLNNATLNIGSDSISSDFATRGSGAVTLGANFRTIQRGKYAAIGNDIIIDGSVIAGVADGDFSAYDATNDGSILVENGDTFSNGSRFTNAAGGSLVVRGAGSNANFGSTYIWSNAGHITFDAGSSGEIGEHWTNTGLINLESGASLTLSGTFTTASLTSIVGAGKIHIEGKVNNIGSTLDLGAGAVNPNIIWAGGEIAGGTIVNRGGGVQLGDGPGGDGIHLAGVTFDGDLDLSAAGSVATISQGFAEKSVSGTGSGKIDLTGAGSYISADGGERFSTATLDIGAAGAGSALYVDDVYTAVSVLSLGVHFTIVQAGLIASLAEFGGKDADSGLVNDGTILAGFAGGTFSISTPLSSSAIVMRNFTNNGSIRVSNGDTFELQAQNFTNLSHAILTGGGYEVDAGSILELADNAEIVTDDATIILSGAGSTIQALDTTSSDQVTIDTTLAAVGSGGVLEILGGRDWTSARVFRNAGTLDLGGGTFDVARLANTGLIDGFGVITPLVSNTGSITAAGGALEIEKQITGAGQMNIDAAATLQVDAASTPAEVVSFTGASGTLALGTAASFLSRIRGFAVGDTIDLLDTAATSATFEAGDKLVITDGGSTIATLRLVGAYGGDSFNAVSDGHGGTDITLTAPAPAAAPHALVQAMAAVAVGSGTAGSAMNPTAALASTLLATPH